eukprot:TRINITY_DN11876_c0_g1_i4.p1 TRINITY_DN11876_c0_g1~~TRINITY_DN11876_c0_g1_i4.p1  ORF type:complete len:335 (+),score=48.20 TRINITY_DN11876_c0_g1_i4:122-1126(+)
MIRRPPRSTLSSSSAASDVYKRQAGVNPSDTYVRLGPEGPWAATPHLLPELPFTPGKDGAGVVTMAHPSTGLCPGERVYWSNSLSGTLAEYAVVDSRELYRLPPSVSFAQGACIGVPCATAYRALFQRGRVEGGEAVLVHGGSGAVGLAAVELAASAGCHVVGTAGSEAGIQAVLSAGAASAVNHRVPGYPRVRVRVRVRVRYLSAALSSVGKGGFDVLLEMAAHHNLVSDCGVMAPRGRVCIVGSRADPIGFNPRLVMPGELDVMGVFLPRASREELAAIHAALYELMCDGKLRPVVGTEVGLEEVQVAHEEVVSPSRGGAVGNVVVLIPNEI